MTESRAFYLDKVLEAIAGLERDGDMPDLAHRLYEVIETTPIREMMPK